MSNESWAIVAEDLRKTYGQTKAVDGISLKVAEGEIFGMLGPNGAGKSTTIEIVEGLRVADSGVVTVLGLKQPRAARVQRRIRHPFFLPSQACVVLRPPSSAPTSYGSASIFVMQT